MSKKRRTRAQKARAAERRHEFTQPSEPSRPAVTQPAEQKQPSAPAEQLEQAPTAVAPNPKPVRSSTIDLRTSLIIFGTLIGAQLVLWLLFHFTTLNGRLYNLIKL